MASTTDDPVYKSIAETKAKYVRLGKSGLRISVPILGAMSLGAKNWAQWTEEEGVALPLLKAAFDRGLNTWDTANVYSNGVSERLIAKAIKKYDIPRHKVVIMTKCYGYVGEDVTVLGLKYGQKIADSKDYVNQGGLSRQAIFTAVERSLERLETSYIDVLQIHRFDSFTPIEETMEALNDLVRAGKVRYLGASSMWTYQFAMMQFCAEKNGWTKFVSMQNFYNLLYREEEREMNKFCNETGVGLVPWGPLCRGHLARPPSDFGKTTRSAGEMGNSMFESGHRPEHKEIARRVHELAGKKGWPMSHVTLAWTNKRVTAPIIGFSSVERMDEALAANGLELSEEEEKYLEEPYLPQKVQGHS
ncbi:NADP-dependent oxidoreductase domain-containing protein [Lineolata rhizophorae]|uniref:NADP-dependent oxidoreductase domain-containing protein n=1 Tax=Lineolata rhizophorae TaxID=578093 RepID=A0A6A6P4S6_9PEZI|nr:NADP-dependent oxidoreductase domain-containing protein [Lineolata rhizophorae]